ncbi:MAG: GSCFA domain-containing protein [Bacteroidales bacterium]|nr:GSCFA domain-containing protein [Bacteroidales bacterium]
MVKLSTPIVINKLPTLLSLGDKIMVLGSCFADNIGSMLADAGFSVCINPFGTLYNPVSIANSAARLQYAAPFRPEECIEMGAGAGMVCSWWHHTSFARKSAEDFLDNANRELAAASEFWKGCNKVVVTLGTAMVWQLAGSGEVVSNCLKRPSAEFSHEMLGAGEIAAIISKMTGKYPDKEFIFTVSPVRHPGEGMHRNTLSKANLHIGLEQAVSSGGRGCYFPAYEILMDELRDYRYYADDLLHPSPLAIRIIQEKFFDACTLPEERKSIEENIRKAAAARHRPLLRR